MRTHYRYLGSVVPLVLILLLVSAPAQGQFKLNTFDQAAADTQFAVVFNGSANSTEPNAIHIISDDVATKNEGLASLKNVWRVHTTEDYGGFNMLSFTVPGPNRHGFYPDKYRAMNGDSTYLNWDAGTHLSLWYYNASPSTATGDAVQMRFHIYEGGEGGVPALGSFYADSTNYEDWYFQSPLPLNDTSPGWHELIIPLVDTGTRNSPSANGFCITDWSAKHGNDKLDLDKIIGYTIEWTSTKVPSDTASGIVFYDDLRLEGIGSKTGYEAVYKYNDYTKDTADWNKAGWNNGGLSSITFFNEVVDTLMSPSAFGWDWKINTKETWGGGCNQEYNLPPNTYLADLSSKSALQLYVKVLEPLTCSRGAIQNKVTMRFVLFDYSDGQKEEWYTIAPVRMDSIGVEMGWQVLNMPLDWIQSNNWADLKAGRFNTPNGGKDNILAFDKLGGYKVEFSSSRDDPEPYGDDLVYSSKILFSVLVPTGFKETDHTAPDPVTGVQATPLSFANVVTWTDVPNEIGSTYMAYVSDKSFASTDEAGVENIPTINGLSMPLNTEVTTHPIFSPKTDQNLSLYYGITATDKAGNTNQPTVIGPIQNTAKGIPTIAMATVNNFAADGDLTEWTSTSAITPLVLTAFGSSPTAHVATNTTIGSDADLKATVYLAADPGYLYVAFDVDDDVFSNDTVSTASTWLQDTPDLFIGLYDWRGKHHGAYLHGATPDYHLRFCQTKVIVDNDGAATILTPGANYGFTVKQLTSGYVVEARIPWSAFKSASASDSLFSPIEGMRIPIDFAMNDNDTPGNNTAREGIMCFSPITNDQSYADVWRWQYTWLGDKSTVGVNDQPAIARVYELQQNYPNPFNPSTIIRYSLAKSGPVTVKVFDVIGRQVATLVSGEVQSAGEHQVTFSSASLRNGAASGVYFYRIESGSFTAVKKMMLIK
jgi:hypothetical protein